MKAKNVILIIILMIFTCSNIKAQLKPDTLRFKPFIWKSEPPLDCPFEQSREYVGIGFLGMKSGFNFGDTWYPAWADDDKLYSPWTDGFCWRLDGSFEYSNSGAGNPEGDFATTGQGVIEGNDPMNLKVYSLGTTVASALPYQGRYPCGSLVYNGIWYYGTYCLGPTAKAKYGDNIYYWPWLGPFVGFRYSSDFGRSWKNCPHTPERPLFGETGINGYPVKIGSPHFVDFGKNMQYSPDGKAYLVAHGADTTDTKWRFSNDSWITGDQIYLLRVIPNIENINDISKYEYYAGNDDKGEPVWTNDFKKIKPLLKWNNNMGCVTVTYNAPLKKFLMCITDGVTTFSKYHTYILESDKLTGKWKLVTYLKNFGEQAYFVNFPSKFIGKDGKTAWLLYSANFGIREKEIGIPPGTHYGFVLQKIELLNPESFKKFNK